MSVGSGTANFIEALHNIISILVKKTVLYVEFFFRPLG